MEGVKIKRVRYKYINVDSSVKIISPYFYCPHLISKKEFLKEFQNPYGFVYKVTNLINDKIYIGITIRDVISRWKDHIGESNKKTNNRFHNAIRKYGESNFEIEVLYNAKSKRSLLDKEIFYIKQYNTTSKKGYNSTTGGEYPSSIKNNSGKNNSFYGKKHSKETKLKMRLKKLGGKLSQTHKENISKSLIGHPPNYDMSNENNPMFGKNVYKIWIKKYGEKTAKIKYNNWKMNCSISQKNRFKKLKEVK